MPQLFNTAITRAREWLVVVGEPITLCTVGSNRLCWLEFIRKCRKLGTFEYPNADDFETFLETKLITRFITVCVWCGDVWWWAKWGVVLTGHYDIRQTKFLHSDHILCYTSVIRITHQQIIHSLSSDTFKSLFSMMAASLKVGGYQCKFIDEIPDDLLCKSCTHVARQPHLTSCCGAHYCHTCITAILQDREAMPQL